ncbi:MAG: hypothetical protein ACRDDZ_07685 [Marinifilaceae bacterium]
MPYRRLPNTDAARIRALKAALEVVDNISVNDMAYSFSLRQRIEFFLPKFEAATSTSKDAKSRQCENSPKFNEYAKKARLYVSHFIQVLNMCIARGELKPQARLFYGLDEHSAKVPNLVSEADLVEWGDKIIKGDAERMSNRMGNPIYCPSIAVVKSHFENFKQNYSFQKMLQVNSARYSSEVAQIRANADALILLIWNEIESHYETVEDLEERRKMCENYGITYVFRRGEREMLRRKKEAEKITLKLF